jgi:hypothetical protein
MIRHGERRGGAVDVPPDHGNVLTLANDLEAERLERADDA